MNRIVFTAPPNPRRLAALVLAFAAILFASSVRGAPAVQLVLSTPQIAPTTTFEFRFPAPMVDASALGKPAELSPVQIAPAVKGAFTWLSTRSGAFTPEEPLPLGTTFRFDLRPGLEDTAKRAVAGAITETVATPPFALKGWNPAQWFNRDDTTSDPRINLLFNADVRAEDAAKFLHFVNADGRTVPVRVVQADALHHPEHRFPRYRSSDGSLLTWAAAFHERAGGGGGHRSVDAVVGAGRGTDGAVPSSGATPRLNQLFVQATEPLGTGKGWKLVLAAGLPAADGSARLIDAAEVEIGTVQPFVVRSVHAMNDGAAEGRRIVVAFSKTLGADVKPDLIAQWITIQPQPANLAARVQGSVVTFTGDFELHTRYQIEIAAGTPAAQPFTLAEAWRDTVSFEPIPASIALEEFATHQLSTGTRQFQMRAVNVPRLRVHAKLFQPDTLPFALTAYDEYLEPPRRNFTESHRRIDPDKIAGTVIYSRSLTGTDKVDAERGITLKWDEVIGAGKTGVVLVTAEAESAVEGARPGVQAIVQVTDLGVVWKTAKTETFAHVFSLASGAPVAGAKVRLISSGHTSLADATTDASGAAKLPANADARWLLAQHGADLHLVPLNDWENRLSLYRFRIPHHEFDDEGAGASDGRQTLMFTERDVYRPGETVYIKAIVRDTRAGQPRIPAGVKARLQAFDNREREIFSREIVLSALGALDAQIPLPSGTRGTYRATLTLDGGESLAERAFEVQEYTPNAFEIHVDAPRNLVGAAVLELPVSANYFMGKKLSAAQLAWSLQGEDEGFAPDGFGDFSFCDAIEDYRLRRALGHDSHFADQGRLELGADGRTTVATRVPINAKAPQPRSATLLCEITDLNQQTVSQSEELTLHSSDFYLGIGTLPDVVRQGDKLPFALVAVRTDGTPMPEPVMAKLRVTRIDWQNNRIVTDEDSSEYQSEPVFTPVFERDVTTQTAEQREHRWSIAQPQDAGVVAGEPGLYLLEALAKDAAGRDVLTSATFHVSGESVTEWNYRNQFQIELVPDKSEYLSGETARVLVKTPIEGDALVTVERDSVLRSFVTKLGGNAPSVDVPLDAADAPNVFVSVMMLRGADASPRKFKEPDYRVGFCQIKVTRAEAKLAVYVAPERKDWQPGETVNVAVEVRDSRGQPRADAEVTLYAVDEGVLSLTGYETPDPLAFFNRPLPLTVATSLTIPTLLRENPEEKHFENKGYLIGGGGEMSDAFRKNFVTCAFWNADLRTDSTGRVNASFTAPDSLTRYRLVAVVQTADDAFGAGESAIEVSKPVMLEPALPRFANLGDKLLLRGVLHNLTDVAGEAEVRLDLDETAATESATRRVALPARGSVPVDFPVEFRQMGQAKWTWVARFTGADGKTAYRDTVQTTLKVGSPVTPMREVITGRIDEAETDLLAKADPVLLEGRGVVRVSLGNSRAIELREALDQVLHYPYGCVEQTTSSTLPWIALAGIRPSLPQFTRSEGDIRAAVNRGVDRLFAMQTGGGALGYWPGAKEPCFWGSAYAGLCLALAKRAGFDVPAEPFDQLMNYLSAQLRGASGDRFDRNYGGGGPSDRCLSVYTLAVAGRAEPAYHEILFQRQASLSAENRALLALAIAEGKGPAAMIEELLRPSNAQRTGDDDPFWNSSRDAAVQLLAWSRFQPEAGTAESLATQLFGNRVRGHWSTTQGNSWALLALSEYIQRIERPQSEVAGALAWEGGTESFELNANSRTHRAELALGAKLALANPGKARLFTEIEIVSATRTLSQPRQDQGYAIERSYAKIEDDGTLSELTEPRVGDRVLVTLRIDVRRNARYVAVDDPLPSIFEAVNPVFKSQATRAGEVLGTEWSGDFQELRDDRALFFADWLAPGTYTIRYLARVRAAGTATAPAAKIEEMYRPERFGTTATMQLTSLPLK